MEDTTATLDPEGSEVGTDGLTEAERRAQAEGRKKHSRPVVSIVTEDGQTVLAEKVWGSALFPKDIVREFSQYCRDIGRKSSDILEEIIRKGITPVFAEMEATKAERDAARSVKKIANDEETLIAQARKMKAKQDALALQMEAIRARAVQIRAQKGEGAVDVLAAILGTDDPETAPVTPKNGRNGVKGKK